MAYTTRNLRKLLLMLFAIVLNSTVFSQEEQQNIPLQFSGTASVTHNGVSLIPTFSLGDPAAIFLLKFKKERFSVEPDLRFALEGKPWSFLVWFRYQAIKKERFSFRVGAHPALNFATLTVDTNGVQQEVIASRRFLAYEVAPSYDLTKNISIGAYYLYARGFDATAKNNHFAVLSTTFKNIAVTHNLHLNLTPQVFYLQQDRLQGYYATGFATLAKRDFPFTLSAIVNQAIDTQISPEQGFIWSVSLDYHF